IEPQAPTIRRDSQDSREVEVLSKVLKSNEPSNVPTTIKKEKIEEFKPVEKEEVEEEGPVSGCRRGFERFRSIFSRSQSDNRTSQQADAAAPQSMSELERQQQTEETFQKILDVLKGNKLVEPKLKQIKSSVSKEVFGDAISKIFKDPLSTQQKKSLRE